MVHKKWCKGAWDGNKEHMIEAWESLVQNLERRKGLGKKLTEKFAIKGDVKP